MSDWHWVKSTLPRLISSRRYDTIYLNADNLLQSRRRVELKPFQHSQPRGRALVSVQVDVCVLDGGGACLDHLRLEDHAPRALERSKRRRRRG